MSKIQLDLEKYLSIPDISNIFNEEDVITADFDINLDNDSN